MRWVRPARQQRSQDTLDRLLGAAEELLEHRHFEQLTVQELVRRAKSSVGAFYARFADKESLLAAMYDRHQQEALATVAVMLDPARWQGVSTVALVKTLVGFVCKLYRRKRGLMRALVLHGHAHPDWRYADPRFRDANAVGRVGELFAARSAEIAHSDPRLAGSLGFLMVMATLREKILFGESTASAVRVDDRRLETELVRAYLAYLGVKKRPGATL